jgi:hypothetical protein
MVQGQPGQIVHEIPISKITRTKWTWRCGSSCRAPEFKPQFHQKEEEKKRKTLHNKTSTGYCS